MGAFIHKSLIEPVPCRWTLIRGQLVWHIWLFSHSPLNFTCPSLDWIEDSILERSRRLREAKNAYTSSRTANGHIALSWLISQIRKLVVASQSWFVVSIVGEQPAPLDLEPRQGELTSSHFFLSVSRCRHRNKRRNYLYNHGVALRSQDRLLLGRLVAQPAVLLLGAGRRG